MLFCILFIAHVCIKCSESRGISTTTKTYELDIPGSESSIKIVEGDSPWDHDDRRKPSSRPHQHRGYKHGTSIINKDTNMGDSVNEENFSPHALEEFLNAYSEKLRKQQHPSFIHRNRYENSDKPSIETQESSGTTNSYGDEEEKPKRWNLMHIKKHNHPFDDKSGWVSLDPVPWSLSKISKWHSEKKAVKKPQISYADVETAEPSWDADLETSEYDGVPDKPFWYQKLRPYKVKPVNHHRPLISHTYSDEETEDSDDFHHLQPTIVIHSPELSKFESMYGHKIQFQYDTGDADSSVLKEKDYLKRPNHNTDRHDSQDYTHCDHSSEGILTDSRPSNFPNFHHGRKKTSGLRKTHPFSGGNGEWVLLSTTKGFKSPQNRRRSLQFPPSTIQNKRDSVGFRKGVHLTVLPPLKDSKVNMTTSHGGLLQVESTFETVDQAQEKQARKLKRKEHHKKRPAKIIKNNKVVDKPLVHKMNIALPISTMNKRISNPDISAVLAAAGAGMIPATMAMLVPMAMGAGKKRRRRNVHNLYFLES